MRLHSLKKNFLYRVLILTIPVGLFLVAPVSYANQSGEGENSTYDGPTDASINSSAKKANTYQMVGALVSAGTGAYLAKRCASDDKWACPMAAMAFAQAATTFANAQDSANTDRLSWDSNDLGNNNNNYHPSLIDPNNPFINDGSGNDEKTDSTFDNFNNDFNQYGVNDAIRDLQDNGYEVDLQNGTVDTPEGTMIFKEAAQAAYGSGAEGGTGKMSLGTIAGAKKMTAHLNSKYSNKYKVHDISVDGGGGGGGGRANALIDREKRSGFNQFGLPKFKPERKTASVAGLSKKTKEGDLVGVAGDNIFEMVTRRYKTKHEQLNSAPGFRQGHLQKKSHH